MEGWARRTGTNPFLGGLAVAMLLVMYLAGRGFLLPLPPLGAGVEGVLVLAGLVGPGLMTGRWRALLLAPIFALGLSWGERSGFSRDALWGVVLLLAAGVIAAGVLVRKLAGLGRGRLKVVPVWLAALGSALVALGLAPFAWAAYRHVEPLDRTPARPQVIDLGADTFRGIGLGRTSSEVIAVLGRPLRQLPAYAPGSKVVVNNFLSYHGVGIVIDADRVLSFDTGARAAQTREGVGIGDNLQIARDTYPGLRCHIGNGATDGDYFPVPYCSGEVAPGRWAYFQEDPIENMCVGAREKVCG